VIFNEATILERTTDEERVHNCDRLKRNQVVKIGRLRSSKNFSEKLMFNTFDYLKPVERSKNGSDMSGSAWGLNNSTSKRVLNLLEPIN